MATTEEEELRLLYQVSVSDLTYFKAQQWSVAYYAFLIQAGLVGVAQLLGTSITSMNRAALIVLAALGAIVALFILGKLQASIVLRQARLDAVREQFGGAFNRAWTAHSKPEERIHSIVLLRGGVVVTALLSAWLIGLRLGVA